MPTFRKRQVVSFIDKNGVRVTGQVLATRRKGALIKVQEFIKTDGYFHSYWKQNEEIERVAAPKLTRVEKLLKKIGYE